MRSLLAYYHRCFVRSYRYGPPSFIFIAGIVLIYSVVPNPVMNSYAFSTAFLFVISAMLTYAFIDIELPKQESITLLHAGSLVKMYIAKLMYCWLFSIPFALFAIVYPAMFQSFDRSPTIDELFISFLLHLISSLLAIAIACWFSAKFITSRLISFLTLFLIVVISLSGEAIKQQIPDILKISTFLIPPLHSLIDALINYDTMTTHKLVTVILSVLVYVFILLILFFTVLNKRKLERKNA